MSQYANNASTILAQELPQGDTDLWVAITTGSLFPDTGSGFFYLTLSEIDANGTETAWEIVKVTARTVDWFSTIERGQFNTSDRTWAAGSRVQLRVVAGQYENFQAAYEWGDHSAANYHSANQGTNAMNLSSAWTHESFTPVHGTFYSIAADDGVPLIISMPETPGDKFIFGISDYNGTAPVRDIILRPHGVQTFFNQVAGEDCNVDVAFWVGIFMFHTTNSKWVLIS